jgi:hypothetical protein
LSFCFAETQNAISGAFCYFKSPKLEFSKLTFDDFKQLIGSATGLGAVIAAWSIETGFR